jgi:hypothetical protein
VGLIFVYIGQTKPRPKPKGWLLPDEALSPPFFLDDIPLNLRGRTFVKAPQDGTFRIFEHKRVHVGNKVNRADLVHIIFLVDLGGPVEVVPFIVQVLLENNEGRDVILQVRVLHLHRVLDVGKYQALPLVIVLHEQEVGLHSFLLFLRCAYRLLGLCYCLICRE